LRVLGLPLASPLAIAGRVLNDAGAIVRAAREAPGQLDRIMELG